MSSGITIGETTYPADIRNIRGTITVGVSQQEDADGGRPMIGIAAAMMGTSCFTRLTIEEAETLRGALDTLITEATARLGESATERAFGYCQTAEDRGGPSARSITSRDASEPTQILVAD